MTDNNNNEAADIEAIRRSTRKEKRNITINFAFNLALLLFLGAGAIYEHHRYVVQLHKYEETARRLDGCLQGHRSLLKEMRENRIKHQQLMEQRDAVTH